VYHLRLFCQEECTKTGELWRKFSLTSKKDITKILRGAICAPTTNKLSSP
jgi:hypothetical protein